ncbi:maleylpyruvate isomerase N-terminal domain-containing protein [Actinoplanes sp. NPDC023936]|uniref:maleylpyruvate isomerase N-terminal domain-containing protein n=1 Tax=Actinoplanes sp. NPDC023936 TaxID=3154910 RepID=UPI0033DE7FDE
MDADHVGRAVAEMLRVLTPHTGADWTVPARDLDWSCHATAAHIAHDLIAYATQLTGRPAGDYLPLDLTVRPSATPDEVLRVISACAGLLGVALRACGPEVRAWHWGPTDPSGFAALGVNEILLHTYDIAGGLGLDWQPPATLCAEVLDRLFPDAPSFTDAPPFREVPPGEPASVPPGDAASVLLWCTGRTALPGLPRRTSWSLRAAVG